MKKILAWRWMPQVVFVLCLAPLAWLAYRWTHNMLGFNRIEAVARFTGDITLRTLFVSLAITPLRQIPGLSALIRFRRELGLFAFFYGCLHALHYFWIDVQWNWMTIREDVTTRRFFIAGMLALTLLVPLAATSFDKAIRWMGGKRWQLLHRLVYVSAIAGVVHYYWQAKAANLEPLIYAAVLAVLLLARVALWIRKKRPGLRPAVASRRADAV